MTYNEIIKKAGKRITKYVYYFVNGERIDVNIDNIDRVKFTSLSSIIGTAINGCELLLKEQIDGEIYVKIEARYQQNIAYKIYGPYYLKETPQYNADKKNYTHKLYDNMMKSMIEYEAVTITYPCTVYDFFIALINKIGYTTNILGLPNGSQIMQSDIYTGINYTCRDVLEDIAIANGILLYIDGNEVKIAYPDNENMVYIDDKILKNKNISFGQHFGPINSIVLSRSADSDTVYLKDDESIAQNGLHEFKIKDNQLMNDNNRSDYLPALLNKLKGIEYDIYDTELTGFGDLIPLQKVVFDTGGKTYNSYIFNNEITLTTGYKQAIYNDMPEESETDYNVSDKTDKRINQTYIMIDKQNQNIEALASRVIDVSNTITGIGTIQLENAYEGTLHRLEITGNINCLFPADDLYPADNLYPLDTYLIVDENEYHLDFTYLNYLSSSVCDKWVYEDGKQWIERKIGIDNQENLYPLNEPIIEEKEDLIINVSRNSEISLESFENANITAIYLLENEYTDNFTTNLDIIAKINLLPGLATINANKIKLEGYTTINENFGVDLSGNMFAIDGNFSGNIFLKNGNKVVGGDGLLTNLQYVSQGILDNGFTPLGFEEVGFYNSYKYADVKVDAYIPKNFTIIEAYLTLYTSAIEVFDSNNDDVGTGICKNLKLYKGYQDYVNEYYVVPSAGFLQTSREISGTEILNGINNQTSYTPPAILGSANYVKSINIAEELEEGRNIIFVRTSLNKPNYTPQSLNPEPYLNSGIGKAVLDIIGYMSFENN